MWSMWVEGSESGVLAVLRCLGRVGLFIAVAGREGPAGAVGKGFCPMSRFDFRSWTRTLKLVCLDESFRLPVLDPDVKIGLFASTVHNTQLNLRMSTCPVKVSTSYVCLHQRLHAA